MTERPIKRNLESEAKMKNLIIYSVFLVIAFIGFVFTAVILAMAGTEMGKGWIAPLIISVAIWAPVISFVYIYKNNIGKQRKNKLVAAVSLAIFTDLFFIYAVFPEFILAAIGIGIMLAILFTPLLILYAILHYIRNPGSKTVIVIKESELKEKLEDV